MTPLWPVESWWTSEPWSTQVTISMSWCGCVSNPVPASTMSSLLTSSSPWWVLRRSKCWPKEKECLESSQPKLVLDRSSARRTSTVGVRLTVLTDAVLSRTWVELAGLLLQRRRRGRPSPEGLAGPAAGGSGVLDRRDLELQDDLVADQNAAGLQRGVPGDAVVLAAYRHRALEAQPHVAERVGRGALELERDGDRVGDAPDRQVARQLEGRLVQLAHRGRDEGDLRVLGQGEEVVAAQVLVALGVAGVDARGVDDDPGAGAARVGAVDHGGALEGVEGAADLGHHRVPGDEADPGVRGVEGVGAGQVGLGGSDGLRGHCGLRKLWRSS